MSKYRSPILLLLRCLEGRFDFVGNHLAFHGMRREQHDHRVGVANICFNLARPFDANGKVFVHEYRKPVLRELLA